jgi:hypothetical protein
VIYRGGHVILPAFAVGRSQEIVLMLEDSGHEGWPLPQVPWQSASRGWSGKLREVRRWSGQGKGGGRHRHHLGDARGRSRG